MRKLKKYVWIRNVHHKHRSVFRQRFGSRYPELHERTHLVSAYSWEEGTSSPRNAGRPISLAIACSFPWSLLTLRHGIFVPLDRKFHVPKDHQHHYQRSHRRVALASIISVRRLIRARQWLLWKVGLFLARYLRVVSRAPLLAIAAQRGNLAGSLFDSETRRYTSRTCY